MLKLLSEINKAVWGIPLLILIGGTGAVISVLTRFAQFRLLPEAFRSFLRQFRRKPDNNNGITPFRALCTALAATIGTGNLAGVAGAIAIGGPGAIFWMWIFALLGMVIKFAEVVLAVRFRTRNAAGEYVGGPMYMIQYGMGKRWSWMAVIYCFFGVIASLGVGNATQINTVISGVETMVANFEITMTFTGRITIGLVLSLLISVMLAGGAKRIGLIAEFLVPFVSAGYVLLALTVIVMRVDFVPEALSSIFKGAFFPRAVTGGAIGSALSTLRVGASRGIFTNEAGMGTASIAHAAANVKNPVEQGMMGIIEVFLDTIVICTMTALVILCSGVKIPYGTDIGVQLTTEAFSAVCGDWVSVVISFSLCCFAIATILGWSLYGARCAQYLFGETAWNKFLLLQAIAAIAGAVLQTGTVWMLSDIVNGLMAIPNLITLLLLVPEVVRILQTYSEMLKKKKNKA